MTTTILSQTTFQLKAMEPLPPGDYTQGFVLSTWTECGRTRIALDRDELLGVLRVLPTAMLVEVLGERGVLCTMGGEAPDVARELDALAVEQHAEKLLASMKAVPGKQMSREMRPPLTVPDDMPQSGTQVLSIWHETLHEASNKDVGPPPPAQYIEWEGAHGLHRLDVSGLGSDPAPKKEA